MEEAAWLDRSEGEHACEKVESQSSMSRKAIILEASILIRAVLGKRVPELIFDNAATVEFFAPDVAYADARKCLPALLKKRGVDARPRSNACAAWS